MRARLFVCLALVGFLVDCRDILGIASDTTIDSGSQFDGPTSTQCGTLTPLRSGRSYITAVAADDNGLFWVETVDADTGAIYGLVNDSLFTIDAQGPTPQDLRLDADFVYWNAWTTYQGPQGPPVLKAWPRTGTTKTIREVSLDTLTAGHIATDGAHVYFGDWMTADGGLYQVATPFTDASTPQPIVATGINSAYHVTILGDTLYFDQNADSEFGAGSSVSRVLVDGGDLTLLDNNLDLDDIATANGHAYWADGNGNLITREDGETFAIDQPVDIAVDPTGTYLWVVSRNQGDDIVRITIATHEQLVCTHVGTVGGLSATASRLYVGTAEGDLFSIAAN